MPIFQLYHSVTRSPAGFEDLFFSFRFFPAHIPPPPLPVPRSPGAMRPRDEYDGDDIEI